MADHFDFEEFGLQVKTRPSSWKERIYFARRLFRKWPYFSGNSVAFDVKVTDRNKAHEGAIIRLIWQFGEPVHGSIDPKIVLAKGESDETLERGRAKLTLNIGKLRGTGDRILWSHFRVIENGEVAFRDDKQLVYFVLRASETLPMLLMTFLTSLFAAIVAWALTKYAG